VTNRGGAPHHAHIYYLPEQRPAAEALRDTFLRELESDGAGRILFVGRLSDRPVGPHPIPQFEIHFGAHAVEDVAATIEKSGLRALLHPLTDDDLADHTSLARWIGEPVALDVSVLDPPGRNQGVARFGRTDF
jgi:aromatic ring-cleaving dioxygenase